MNTILDPIGTAATLGSGFKSAMSADDFLQLFSAQLQYQDPTAPMSNSEMMQQLSQITQLQAVSELTTGMQNMLHNNELLQASGLIGRTVEYVSQADVLVQGAVKDVQIDNKGGVTLGLIGDTKISLDAIRRVF